MVKIEEVNPDQDWEDDSDAASSSASDIESEVDDSFDPASETLKDRFLALKDIVSPSTRASIADSAHATVQWTKWAAGLAGQAAWIVTTSALLVGLPAMLSIEGEGALVAHEKEFMGQQVSAREVIRAALGTLRDPVTHSCYVGDGRTFAGVIHATPKTAELTPLFARAQAAPAAAFGAPAPGQPQATGVVPPGF